MKKLSKEFQGGMAFAGLALCVFVLVGFGTQRIGHAQEKPPAMSPEMGIKLRDAVLLQARLVIQLNTTIETYNQLQAALPAQKKKIDDLKTAALADAKLDSKDWDVDVDKFEFVPRATPADLSKPTGGAVIPAKKP